jgi:hypothetical protein
VGIKFYNKAPNFMVNSYKNNKYIILYIRLNDKVRNSMGKFQQWVEIKDVGTIFSTKFSGRTLVVAASPRLWGRIRRLNFLLFVVQIDFWTTALRHLAGVLD